MVVISRSRLQGVRRRRSPPASGDHRSRRLRLSLAIASRRLRLWLSIAIDDRPMPRTRMTLIIEGNHRADEEGIRKAESTGMSRRLPDPAIQSC
jgi:hypothetical protein